MIIVIDDCFCDAGIRIENLYPFVKDSFFFLQKWQYYFVVLIILYASVRRLLEVL